MNWYDFLMVGENDIRLTKNHVAIQKLLYNDKTFELPLDDFEFSIGDTIWVSYEGFCNNYNRFMHLLVTGINKTYELQKIKNDIPNSIVVQPHSIHFSFARNRVGPASITMNKNGGLSCQFEIWVRDSLRFDKGRVVTTISIPNVVENDVIDPFGTEFFKDPLIKMEFLTFIKNTGMSALSAQDRIQAMLRGTP